MTVSFKLYITVTIAFGSSKSLSFSIERTSTNASGSYSEFSSRLKSISESWRHPYSLSRSVINCLISDKVLLQSGSAYLVTFIKKTKYEYYFQKESKLKESQTYEAAIEINKNKKFPLLVLLF